MYSSAKLMGGLGNQMFQIAHAYVQALEAQAKGLDVTTRFDPYVSWIEQFPERQAVNYQTNILQRVDFTPTQVDWFEMNESGFNHSEIVPVWDKSVKFNGYFQSPKYFKNHIQKVRELFAPPDEVKIRMLNDFPQLAGNVTAVFVRRGDYLKYPEIHPPTTEEYLQLAIETSANTSIEYYLVVSDDYAWCDEVLPKYLRKNKIINASLKDWEQLWLASLAKNFICTNSSFGWWSSFLAEYPDKQIIFPAKWFGPSGAQNWKDIYPENCIVL